MLHARGKYMLMVDSDGATRIEDLDTLQAKLKAVENAGFGIAIGNTRTTPRQHIRHTTITLLEYHRKTMTASERTRTLFKHHRSTA
jgi:precorrin-3B methylase